MSLRRRFELVRLAIEYNTLIVSDDVYDFLWWPQDKSLYPCEAAVKLPPRLVDINKEIDPNSAWGNTVSNGSFSKIIAPGVRVSWAEGTSAFATWLANTGATWSGGNLGHLSVTFISEMFSSGTLDKHIKQRLIRAYATRFYAMVDAIKEHLEPLGIRITTGKPYEADASEDGSQRIVLAGGLFLLITLPDDSVPAPVLAQAALENYHLKFAYGKMFEVKGDKGSIARSNATFANSIRLCWAFHDEKAIEVGIKRLRDAYLERRAATT